MGEKEKSPFQMESRLTAWDIIKREGFSRLPVHPEYFLSKYHINLVSYGQYAKTAGLTMDEVAGAFNEDGFLVYQSGKYYLVFNEEQNPRRKNWTLMHEAAHFLLGHVGEENPILLRDSTNRTKKDREADALASRILCPSIVLHMCCVESPEEIAALCGISLGAGQVRWNHISALRRKDKFLKTEEERQILMQFAPFISSYLCRKFEKAKDNSSAE